MNNLVIYDETSDLDNKNPNASFFGEVEFLLILRGKGNGFFGEMVQFNKKV